MDSTQNNDSGLHKDDCVSVHMWALSMQHDGALLAFKGGGSSVEGGYVTQPADAVHLGSDDFMLSFQLPRQAGRMKKFMEKFGATDSTHHTTKSNDYQLFVMLVADGQNCGEPVTYSLQAIVGHVV